ncbi:MAG: hypothetical protein IKX02_00385 [Spirochaetales bacterium]|nr:hypothetical protein [Spirochaetales bacterium]
MAQIGGNAAKFLQELRQAKKDFEDILKKEGRVSSIEMHIEPNYEWPVIAFYGEVFVLNDDGKEVRSIYRMAWMESEDGHFVPGEPDQANGEEDWI